MTKLRLVADGMVSVKALAIHYGMSKSTLYALIRSDPTFPYLNVGLKKKLMIEAAKFEMWLNARTDKQKDEHFGLPAANGLIGKRRK